jgi:hypothetical protein
MLDDHHKHGFVQRPRKTDPYRDRARTDVLATDGPPPS